MRNLEFLVMMRLLLCGKKNLKEYELRLQRLIWQSEMECRMDEYFSSTKKKTGGVEPEFQRKCLFESQGDQIRKCFGIFELNSSFMRTRSGLTSHVLQHVTVDDSLSLPITSLCNTKKQKMVLRNWRIKI